MRGQARTDRRLPQELQEQFVAGNRAFTNTPIHEGYHQVTPNLDEVDQRVIDLYRGKLLGDQELVDESERYLKNVNKYDLDNKLDLGKVRARALRALMNIEDPYYADLPESSKLDFRAALEKRMKPTLLSSIFGGDEKTFDSDAYLGRELAELPEPEFLDMLKDIAAFQTDRFTSDYISIQEPRTVTQDDGTEVRGYAKGGVASLSGVARDMTRGPKGLDSFAPQLRDMFRR
jgi:hypothetical protein